MDGPRQSKRSREELDVLLIDAGLRLSNASVIGLVGEDQAEFQADVLVAVAHGRDHPEIERMIAALCAVFDGLDFSTVESRARADERLKPHVPWPVSHDTHQSTFGTRRPCVCQYARQSPALQLGVAIVAAASTERPYSIGPEARRGGCRGVRARRRDTDIRLTNASVIRRAWDPTTGGARRSQPTAARRDDGLPCGGRREDDPMGARRDVVINGPVRQSAGNRGCPR
jgi:hypothetical protein